jgi:hypothetical protein
MLRKFLDVCAETWSGERVMLYSRALAVAVPVVVHLVNVWRFPARQRRVRARKRQSIVDVNNKSRLHKMLGR